MYNSMNKVCVCACAHTWDLLHSAKIGTEDMEKTDKYKSGNIAKMISLLVSLWGRVVNYIFFPRDQSLNWYVKGRWTECGFRFGWNRVCSCIWCVPNTGVMSICSLMCPWSLTQCLALQIKQNKTKTNKQNLELME